MPQSHGETGEAALFAVKTTAGKEQEAARGLYERALKEKVPLYSVLAPEPMQGYVLVEAPDFDRLSNLASSVRHCRGVVRARRDPNDPTQAVFPLEQVEPEGPKAVDPPADAGEVVEVPQGPLEGHGKRGRSEASAGGPLSEPARAKAPRGELYHPSAGQARLVNLAIVVPLAVLALGLVLAPRQVWDNFLEPYFWRSVEADASNAGGAAEAYNAVDTLVYALILVPAVLFIYRVLERLRVRVDARFVFMLAPFLVLGGAARALEDAQYFAKPVTYAFISPLIYLAEGLLVLLLVVASWWVARAHARGGLRRGALAWSGAFAPGAAALAYFHGAGAGLVAVAIPAPILASALACAYLAGLVLVARPQKVPVDALVFNAGVLLLGLCAYLIVRWIALGAWVEGATPVAATHAREAPVIIAIALLATSATWVGLWVASRRAQSLGLLLTPLNALVVFSQFLDGSATFWGVDVFGYEEKHVVPGYLMSVTGTAAVMFPLKLGYLLAVLLLTDIVFRKDLFGPDGTETPFAGLLKLAIAALGMGPGTRDMLRLSMGV